MGKKSKSDLEAQLKALEGQITDSEIDVQNRQRALALMKKEADNLRKTINAFNMPAEIKVSDHALMRYCERVLGINFADVKQSIVSEELKNYISKLGTSGTYPINGVQYVVKDNTVVTIID